MSRGYRLLSGFLPFFCSIVDGLFERTGHILRSGQPVRMAICTALVADLKSVDPAFNIPHKPFAMVMGHAMHTGEDSWAGQTLGLPFSDPK